MIVTVGNTKGGVGKTTLALNLAVSRALASSDVWLIDGDRQQTAATAISMRSEAGHMPAIACASYHEGPMLRSQVLQQKAKFTDIVIDVGGRDSTALRAALMVTDVLVVPFQPRSLDVWALSDIAELLKEANSMRDGLRAYAVLNCADPAGADNRDAAGAVEQYPELTYLDAPIHRRKAYANAAGQGMGVQELKPIDEKASAELSYLVRQIYGKTNL
jgi:chromosome partitioning protein